MTKNITVMKTLTLNVPPDTQTVTVHLQVEAQCTCASNQPPRPGSYVDTQPSQRQAAKIEAQGDGS